MRTTRTLKSLLASLALGVALLGVSYSALADKLHLNDGRVLDGEIVRQDADFIVFKVDGKNQIFEMSSVEVYDIMVPLSLKGRAYVAARLAANAAKTAVKNNRRLWSAVKWLRRNRGASAEPPPAANDDE